MIGRDDEIRNVIRYSVQKDENNPVLIENPVSANRYCGGAGTAYRERGWYPTA